MASIVLGIAAAGANPFAAAGLAIAGALIDSYVIAPLLGGDGQTQTIKNGFSPTDNFSGADEGADLKQLYGRHRMAGSVIYASERREEIEVKEREVGGKKGGGGKGGQTVRTETYTYYRTVAYALCGPLKSGGAIEKIWLDSKLVYDNGVADPRAELIEVYDGTQTTASPSIQTIKARDGVGTLTPAYRGTTYVVIKELLGTDWGNRVPSMTAQIRSDSLDNGTSQAQTIVDLASLVGLGDRIVIDAVPSCLQGYYTSGETKVADSIIEIMRLNNLGYQTFGDEMVFFQRDEIPITVIPKRDFVVESGSDGTTVGWPFKIEQRDLITLPTKISVKHTDPNKNYQVGTQTVRRDSSHHQLSSGTPIGLTHVNEISVNNERFALNEQEATAYAQRLISNAYNEKARVTLVVTNKYVWARPGDRFRLPVFEDNAETLDIRVTNVTLRPDGAVEIEGVSQATRGVTVPVPRDDDLDFDGDSVYVPQDLEVILMDLPPLTEAAVGSEAGIAFAMRRSNQTTGSFRTGLLYRSESASGTFSQVGGQGAEAVWGFTLGNFPNGKPGVWNFSTPVRVRLRGGTVPPSATAEEVYAGANLFWINGEIVGVQSITVIDSQTIEMNGFLRGVRTTYNDIDNHPGGSDIVLLSSNRYGTLGISKSEIGATKYFKAVPVGGVVGDADVEAEVIVSKNLRPPAPILARKQRNNTTGAVIDIFPVNREPVVDWLTAVVGEGSDPFDFKVEVVSGTTTGLVDVTSQCTISGSDKITIEIPVAAWDDNGYTSSSSEIPFRITRYSSAFGDYSGFPLEFYL